MCGLLPIYLLIQSVYAINKKQLQKDEFKAVYEGHHLQL